MKHSATSPKRLLTTAALMTALLLCGRQASAESYNFEPIRYESTQSNDSIAQLQQRMDSGQTSLDYHPEFGYLPSILKELKVPISSQGLVFSRTSFQLRKIGPKTPRAVYFSDDMYVGYVQGGDVLEFTAVDPDLGGVFYALDQRQTDNPKFKRLNDDCLQCHSSFVRLPYGPRGLVHLRPHQPRRRTMGRLVRHRHARTPTPHGQPLHRRR
jgi:hypothetical protein